MPVKSRNRELQKSGNKFSDKKQRIYDFLKENPVAVMSSIDPNGNPHGVVIYYNINKRFEITFVTKAETRKYDNLKHHSHVMLTVFDQQTQSTVQIVGKAIEITDSYEVNIAANNMVQASMKTTEAGMAPLLKLEAGPYVAFKIEPVQIRMAVYARPDLGKYAELFESIESFELRENVF